MLRMRGNASGAVHGAAAAGAAAALQRAALARGPTTRPERAARACAAGARAARGAAANGGFAAARDLPSMAVRGELAARALAVPTEEYVPPPRPPGPNADMAPPC